MPRKDIYKDGEKTQFSKTRRPTNPGRRPNVYAKFIKEEVSLDDLKALIASSGLYNADEIEKILGNKKEKPPITFLAILKAMSTDVKKGELKNHAVLWDRAYGKPKETIQHGIGEIKPETIAKLNEVFSRKPQKIKNERKPRSK